MKTFGLVLCLSLCWTIRATAQPIPAPLLQLLPDTRQRVIETDAVLTQYRKALLADFEQRLDQPDAYVRRVKTECAQFPEGDLFPYVLPTFAYASLADRGEIKPAHAQQRIAQLIELSRPAVIGKTKPPAGDLMKLTDYRSHATYLGQFMLALCAYRLASGDDRYDVLRAHLANIFRGAMKHASGQSLNSLPGLNWTFDTIPVLVALHWHDVLTNTPASQPLIGQHWKWLDENGIDPNTKLPGNRPGKPLIPRGCELSWRIALISQIDEPRAKSLYEHYTAAMWLDRGFIVGFREYPPAVIASSNADSGPIIADIGGTASVLGIAATMAMNDQQRLHRLCQQLDAMPEFLPLTVLPTTPPRIAGMIPYDKQYHTGFLYGDITLFYAVTWSKWQFTK